MQKYILKANSLKDFYVSNTEGLHKGYDSCPQLDHEDMEHIDEYDLEEIDLKWQVAMISMRMKKFYKKTGHFARECRIKGNQDNRRRDAWNSRTKDGSRTGKKEDSKALVTIDREGVDCKNHSEEDEDYALMACNSSESDTEVTSCSNKSKESYANLKKLYDAQREQLSDASIEIKAYMQGLKKVEAQFVAHQQGQLWSQVSLILRTKPGADSLNFDDLYNNLRVFESDVKGSTTSSSSPQNVAFVSENTSSTNEISTAYCVPNPSGQNSQIKGNQDNRRRDAWNSGTKDGSRTGKKEDSKALVTIDREGREQLSNASIEIKAYTQGLKKVEAQFIAHQQGQLWFVTAGGMHAVLPPMTGNYMPHRPDIEVVYSQFIYGPKQTQPSESESQTSEFDTCDSNISTEPSELVSEPVVNESNVECQPKVWSDAPIIEEYESDSEDEPFKKTTLLSTNVSKQKVNTAKVNVVSTVEGKRETAVKPSAGCNWRPQRYNWHNDYPHRALKNKGIVDSGCSRHMTGNKAYLAEFQDFNGGPIAFGGSKGYITGKDFSNPFMVDNLPKIVGFSTHLASLVKSWLVQDQTVLEDHLAKFHKMTVAKEMWDAIKSRFGGNDKSKKMFQSLLSQLEIHGAGVDSLSFDDLYNNLRVFESDVKGSTASSSSPQNVALVYENTSSTNDVSTTYCVPNPSGQNLQYEQTSSYSSLANQSSWHFAREYRIKGNQDNKRKDTWNSGTKDGSRTRKKEDSKALVTIDKEGVYWTNHSEEDEDYALMACNSSESDTEREQLSDASIEIKAYTQGLKKVEEQFVAHQQGQLWYEQKIKFMMIDLDDKTDVLTYHKKLIAEAQKEKEDLKAKVRKMNSIYLIQNHIS
ncbi:hypothetical protein Tco_1315039 [Tanacetum coccineum]